MNNKLAIGKFLLIRDPVHMVQGRAAYRRGPLGILYMCMVQLYFRVYINSYHCSCTLENRVPCYLKEDYS